MQIYIQTPLGHTVRIDFLYFYKSIILKHPVLLGEEKEVFKTIESPFTICRSSYDPNIILHYCLFKNKMLCTVIKLCGPYSFLITSYPCESIKQGEILWQK